MSVPPHQAKKVRQMNKKKRFVADGVFQAELHSFFLRALAVAGYSGFELRVTPVKTEIVIKATKTTEVVGPEGRRIKELTSLIQKRFNYTKDNLVVKALQIKHRGLSASAQAESLKYKLLSQVPVRSAANAILKQIMLDGAVGAEVIISGKLSQQRAKSMKYRAGYIISTGQPKRDFIDYSYRHVEFKQGVMGVKVKVFLPYDPTGKFGVKFQVPDKIKINDPKEEEPEEEIRTLQQQSTQLQD